MADEVKSGPTLTVDSLDDAVNSIGEVSGNINQLVDRAKALIPVVIKGRSGQVVGSVVEVTS